jgi:hypothetical protein
MAPSESGNHFVEKLRARDEIAWTYIETKVIPKVVMALRRWFGPGHGWHDLEGFVRSAERTGYRRLKEGTDATLETLECYEDFEKWLVIVAHNKFAMALRKAKVEEKHRSVLLRAPVDSDAGPTHTLGDEAARDVVTRLAASLRDQDERTIFHGKLAGKTEAAIAIDVGCSIRKVRGIWKKVRQRLLREAEPPRDF